MLGNFSFTFDSPIICKAVKYINQSDNSSEYMFLLLLLGLLLIGRLKIWPLMWPYTRWC